MNKHSPSSSDYFLLAITVLLASPSILELPLQVISAGINTFLLLLTKHILSVVFCKKKLEAVFKSCQIQGVFSFCQTYCGVAMRQWSPYNTNINTLEMVQQKAARFVLSDYSTYFSVQFNMLQELRRTLQERIQAILASYVL